MKNHTIVPGRGALGGLLAQMSWLDIWENTLEPNHFSASIALEHFQGVIICRFIWSDIYNLKRQHKNKETSVLIMMQKLVIQNQRYKWQEYKHTISWKYPKFICLSQNEDKNWDRRYLALMINWFRSNVISFLPNCK